MDFRCLIDCRSELGESPVWDDRRERLYFVDIRKPAIHRIALDGSDFRTWAMPDTVGSIGLTESGRLVVALGLSVVVFDPDTADLKPLAELKDEPKGRNRTNDGKVGPDGAFWVGTMDMTLMRDPLGALYRVTADGRAERKIDRLVVSNGLAFSPDGRTMFHSDSRGLFIERWDLDPATGQISTCRRIAVLNRSVTGAPDGAACDETGHYWSAGIAAGRLNRFDPDGRIVDVFATPVSTPTMPCFCGPGLRSIVLTSLRAGFSEAQRAAEPMAGSVFIAQAPVAGAKVGRMAGL